MNRAHEAGGMPLADLPFAPAFVVEGEARHLAVGVDGEMVWLDAATLAPASAPAHPFPGEVNHAVHLSTGRWVCTWIDRELSIARMAAFDESEVDAGFPIGPTRESLRQLDGAALNAAQVQGSIWSHVLDAEPLALCAIEEDLVFVNHTRGIYRIGADAGERWRIALPKWPILAELGGGDVIVKLLPVGGQIHCFTLGGGHCAIDAADGTILSHETLEVEAKVFDAWHHDGEWLLSLSHQRMARWRPDALQPLEVRHVKGPIHDARFDGDGWCIAGWREDLSWDREGLTSFPRKELGFALISHPEKGLLTLSNNGTWSTFGGNARAQNR